MDIVFTNGGQEYRFMNDKCGGGKFITIAYGSNASFQLRDIQLIIPPSSEKKGLVSHFFAKPEIASKSILIIGYQMYSNSEKINYREIEILPSEIDKARFGRDFEHFKSSNVSN